MFKKIKTFKLKDLTYQHITAAIVIVCVIALGLHFIISSFAASPFSSIGASSGKLGTSGSSTVQSCASGSTGQCVQFGSAPTTSLAIHIKGGQLVNGQGKPVRLFGVDASGTEDACIQGKGFSWGFASTPAEDETSAIAMQAWHINAVRVQLNEDCWLGVNVSGTSAAPYSGAAYQTMIENWVHTLNSNGIYTIIDLHWAAPNPYQAAQQWPMADENNAPAFWTSVASTFKSDPAVIFDPFNEPFIGSGAPSSTNWSCWLSGCTTTTLFTPIGATGPVTYTTAGMQQLVSTIRATGANQPIMVGGLNWAGDPCGTRNGGLTAGVCTQIADMPTDPDNQLAISFHTYSWTACTVVGCWQPLATAAKAANLPIITGEFGEDDCSDQYINSFTDWADTQGNEVSYLGGLWEVNEHTPPFFHWLTTGTVDLLLLSSWDGVPAPSALSAEGVDYRAHLLSEAPPTL
jgi:hypothetical protein